MTPAERQRLERHHLGPLLAGEFREERRLLRALPGPRGDDEEQGHPVEPSREIGEEAQARAVAPLGVVDDERHELLRAGVGGEPVEPVQHRVRDVVGDAARRRSTGASNTAAAEPAGPSSQGADARSRASKSWRTTPNA